MATTVKWPPYWNKKPSHWFKPDGSQPWWDAVRGKWVTEPETPDQRKRRVAAERKVAALEKLKAEREVERQAIPAITALVAKGHLLVTAAYMKSVTHPQQKERLTKAVILGKLAREQSCT